MFFVKRLQKNKKQRETIKSDDLSITYVVCMPLLNHHFEHI